jgi:uncharacterized integral membrane protein
MSAPSQQAPTSHEPPHKRERRSSSDVARTGGLIALAVLITLFAVLNLREVKVDWIVGSGHAPLIIVIVISLLVGVLISYLAERLARRRR